MPQKKIVIRLFYLLILASFFNTAWTNNSPSQQNIIPGEDIIAFQPGLTIVPTPPMQTTEGGGIATFTVALATQPAANVTVNLSSSDTTEGIITSPATPSLNFTKGNWDKPQTVTVTGVDDFDIDGDIAYDIVLDPVSIGDPLYDALPNENVGLINIDNDAAGLTIVTTPPMQTTEAGGTASFTVALSSQPIDTVTVALTSDTPTEGVVSLPPIPTLTFTPGDWNIPQPVIVIGVDDSIADNNVAYNIILGPVSSADPHFHGLPNVNVGVTNVDRLSVVTPPSFYTTESGDSTTFTVALSSQPTQNVNMTITSDMLTEGTVTAPLPPTITFTPIDWNIPKQITVTGVSDCQDDGNRTYTVTFNSTSLDPVYNRAESLALVNYAAPTIGWVKPVATEGIYFSDGFSPINLEVESVCPEPVGKVRFTRWVEGTQSWVPIGDDSTAPYTFEILPSELETGWNQVFAFAFSPANPVQTFSEHKRILILLDFDFLLHIPLINK